MKAARKFFALLFCLLAVAALMLPASAADDGYTYEVRIYAGQQGTLVSGGDGWVAQEGGKVLVKSGIQPGTRVTFDLSLAQAYSGGKYRVLGIRESGKDNRPLSALSFEVDRDMDFVVAYYIPSDEVMLTVRYLEYGTDRQLESNSYFYGNVGDRPVVAYKYVDGYTPRNAYNLTGTLVADPDGTGTNVWTFYYDVIPPAATPAPAATAGGNGNNANANANGDNTNANANGENANGENANANGENAGQTEATPEPEDILDLDVPLAGPGSSGNGISSIFSLSSDASAVSKVGIVIGVIVFFALLAALLWFLLFRRRRKEEEEIKDEE